MNFIPSLSAWSFAVAGLVCAAGPIVIHLLNRRRFRTVPWAAMDFLREALQRNRRILELRDVALLALRTLAVLLFGLALAQPFVSPNSVLMWLIVFPAVLLGVLAVVVGAALWSRPIARWASFGVAGLLLAVAATTLAMQIGREKDEQTAFDGSQPLHAVLVIDNSMSMGYELPAGGTLLDRAKERAKQYIERLPAASRVSIIPLCGSRSGYSPDPYAKEDAAEALAPIEVVDRSASVVQAINEARKACDAGPPLGRRVVVFSDQQRANWRDAGGGSLLANLPTVQFVDTSPAEWENTWVSDFRVQDGLADVETPTTFVATIEHVGPSARVNLPVTLWIDGTQVASKTVTLEPGLGGREVRFEYRFDAFSPRPGQPITVPAKVSVAPDRLPADDERHLMVDVVAALPIVFVDQYSDDSESRIQGRLGETRSLRKLLAPVTRRGDDTTHLVKTRHVTIDQLDEQVLADARLVVVAGIADPQGAVPLLRQYVQQGGQLVIAAGGDFDPALWNAAAWLDGAGILPAPLAPLPVGEVPEIAAERLQVFTLSFDSLASHEYFQLADTSNEELRDFYSLPLFFKAVEVDQSPAVLDTLKQHERKRLDAEDRIIAEADAGRDQLAEQEARGNAASVPAAVAESQRRLREVRPDWLLWATDATDDDLEPLPDDAQERAQRLDQLAETTLPRVLARFDQPPGGMPYLVERRIGKGTVLLVTSGLSSSWNTLHTTDTILVFDRILRRMVQSTLPPRNFAAGERITLPLPSYDPAMSLTLTRPGSKSSSEPVETGFVGRQQRGFSIAQPLERGVYQVKAERSDSSAGGEATPLWEVAVAVNGEAAESDLTPLSRASFEERFADSSVGWVGPGEEISLAGAQVRAQNFWMLLAAVVLLFLLVEMVLLALPTASRMARREPAAADGTTALGFPAGGFASNTSSITPDGATASAATIRRA